MSSPIFTIRSDPQQVQAVGASITTRSRGTPPSAPMLGERLLHRLAPVEGANLRRLLRRLLGADGILGRGGFQLLELQLELVDQPGGAFGAAAILLALEHRDLELQARDHRLGRRHHGIRAGQFGLCGRQFGAQFLKFGGGI